MALPPRLALPALAVAAAALLAPLASGHGAPEDDVENAAGKGPFVRLLGDRTDDCGSEAPATNDCKGAHDLVALDVQERWDGAADVLVVRFWLDKARSPAYPVTDTFSFSAGAARKSLVVSTADDATFRAAAGFESVAAPAPAGGGTRFHVDARVRFSTLGVQPGTPLSAFRVESRVGAGAGDAMPGDCSNAAPTPCQSGTPEGQDRARYDRGTYALRGPTYYAALLVPPGTAEVAAGAERLIEIRAANLLKSAQGLEVSVAGADGVTARFHDPAAAGHATSETATVDLAKGGSSTFHLALAGLEAGRSGALALTLTTDLGGRVQAQVPYQVTQAGAATGETGETCPHATGAHGDCASPTAKASPAAPLALAALALLAAARARRS